MHAQSTTTPAQANEVVSSRAHAALNAAGLSPCADLESRIAEIEQFSRDVVRPAQAAFNLAAEAEQAAIARSNEADATSADQKALKLAAAAEARKERAWIAAYEQRDLMISALLDVRVANAEDALRKAEVAIRLSSDGKFTLATTNDYSLLKEVTQALASDIAALAQPAPTPDRAAWDAAISSLRQAKADYDRLAAANFGATAAHRRATMPLELQEPSSWYGVGVRWFNPEHLEKDVLLSPAEKARLLPILMDYWDRVKVEAPPAGATDDDDDALDAADERKCQAEAALAQLQAPTIQDAADRLELVGHDTEFGPIDIYDPAAVLAEAQTDGGRAALNNSFDILRFAGRAVSPIDEFDCHTWIKDYEGTGGMVAAINGNLLLVHAPDDRDAHAMRAALLANPVRAAATLDYAESRQTTGGDPIFWSGGEVRKGVLPLPPTDRVKPYRAIGGHHVEVVTFVDGAPMQSNPMSIAAE